MNVDVAALDHLDKLHMLVPLADRNYVQSVNQPKPLSHVPFLKLFLDHLLPKESSMRRLPDGLGSQAKPCESGSLLAIFSKRSLYQQRCLRFVAVAKSQMWMVRAGEGGFLFEEFREHNYIAIGWNAFDRLTDTATQANLRGDYIVKYPGEKPGKVSNAVAMIYKFAAVLKPGERVTTYSPDLREYLVGTIKGACDFDAKKEYHHFRSVDWAGTVERDSLTAASRNSLGSTLTLFQVNEETADDLWSALEGTPSPIEDVGEEKQELEQLKEDTIGRAHELIKDKILKLNDEDMERLVASILRAMGYKARVTPKGPDRGVDVIASPDGLGLEEPRIKAEVKHRPKDRMGSQQVRSFLGGLRQGDRALYVSTGGFSKDAGYEADRANVPITLLNLDELASLVVTHYENFDMDGRVLIPLTRLYWPVD